MAQAEHEQSRLLDRYRLDPASASVPWEGSASGSSPKRKVTLAVGLLVLGIIFLISGAAVKASNAAGGIPLLIIGGVALLPGAYYSFIAWATWRGKAGYSLAMIPDI